MSITYGPSDQSWILPLSKARRPVSSWRDSIPPPKSTPHITDTALEICQLTLQQKCVSLMIHK